MLFYGYFHGDNGAGIGASHQTGWTGTVARLVRVKHLNPEAMLKSGELSSRVAVPGSVSTDRTDTRS